MAAEYLLAIATTRPPRALLAGLGAGELTCEDTPHGERCTIEFDYLVAIAWVGSAATRASIERTFSVRADVWILLRRDADEPERGHQQMITLVANAVAQVDGDLVPYRDDDLLLSRVAGRQTVSRRLLRDESDARKLVTSGCVVTE